MTNVITYLEYLNVPTKVAIVVVALLVLSQIIGSILDLKGKAVPEIMNIRKYFARKKREKEELKRTISDVKNLLNEVNGHYSADNIAKRNEWMNWVNNRAEVYDGSIEKFRDALSDITSALKDNTKMTEEMFVQSSRDRIIDFATKVENKNTMVSREEFKRIFKVYDKYEAFLKERGMKNGEIDINYQIIKESYEEHLHNHTFIEDIRGYGN